MINHSAVLHIQNEKPKVSSFERASSSDITLKNLKLINPSYTKEMKSTPSESFFFNFSKPKEQDILAKVIWWNFNEYYCSDLFFRFGTWTWNKQAGKSYLLSYL